MWKSPLAVKIVVTRFNNLERKFTYSKSGEAGGFHQPSRNPVGAVEGVCLMAKWGKCDFKQLERLNKNMEKLMGADLDRFLPPSRPRVGGALAE